MSTQDLIGKTVVGIRRWLYVYQGAVRGEEGPLELSFQDGSVAFFKTTGSGNMQVNSETWADPFALPLSPENAEFVRTHGKWTEFDLSSEPPASALIERQVSVYREIVADEKGGYHCPPGECLEAVIAFGDLVVRIWNWGSDEIHVEWLGRGFTESLAAQ